MFENLPLWHVLGVGVLVVLGFYRLCHLRRSRGSRRQVARHACMGGEDDGR